MLKLKGILSRLPGGLLSVLTVLAILWLTLAPDPLPDNELPMFPGADKICHGIMFGGLVFCMMLDRMRRRDWRRDSVGFGLFAFIFSALFGVGIEYAQSYMALGRSFELWDMVADAAGALLTAVLWLLFQKRWTAGAPSKNSDNPDSSDNSDSSDKPQKKRRLTAWVRIPLKTLMWILIVVLLIPVLLYVPPVQTFVVDTACRIVSNSTGMKIEVGRFRLRFPLDVALDRVNIIEASGDTMVRAKSLIADVKLLPLIDGNIDVKRLRLIDGRYNMVSADSSLLMKIDAGLLDVSPGAQFDLGKMHLLLDRAELDRANVQLYMDVWKSKPTPKDTTSGGMLIKARELKCRDLTFGMSLLPTIDTIAVHATTLDLADGVVDLEHSIVTVRRAALADGSATYLTPTPEFVASHPAPVDTVADEEPSAPFTVRLDSVSLDRFTALYGTKGVTPQPGFDASYIKVSDLSLGLTDFYNQLSTLRLPIQRISGRERCGLTITGGSGLVALESAEESDELALVLGNLHLRTTGSRIDAEARIPFTIFDMKPDAEMSADITASLGQGDIAAFMPDMRRYLDAIPNRQPIALQVDATGSLNDLKVKTLRADIPSALSLFASGSAVNPLQWRKMRAQLKLDGELTNPALVDKIAGPMDFTIPALKITGTATADHGDFGADIDLTTSAGDLAANGHVGLNSERYSVNLHTHALDISRFMPDLEIGPVTAGITAAGAGFDPTRPHAKTDIEALVSSIVYKGKPYSDIRLLGWLDNGEFDLELHSPNRAADLNIAASGTIDNGLYTFDVRGNVNALDLQEIGLTETMCSGSVDFRANGTAEPAKWIYNADLDVSNLDWNLPDQYYHLPAALQATVSSTENSATLLLHSDRTDASVEAAAGIKQLIDGFTATAAELDRQIKARSLDVAALHADLPPITLAVNASGRGLLSQLLSPQGMSVDTVWANLSTDSLINGYVGVRGLNTGSLRIDTVGVSLAERNSMLDYRVNVGNRPGAFDEFARVNVLGYLGDNRASMSIRQQNIKGETGYRIGLTAALMDSTVTVHFIPLRATIAYLPWTLNDDNHVDVNFGVHPMQVDANLEAYSNESSIKLLTQPSAEGDEELYVHLNNIRIQDFLSLNVFAPPIKASVSSDLHVKYFGKGFGGKGSVAVNDFYYDRQRVGDFSLGLLAGVDFDGNTNARVTLDVNGNPAAALDTKLRTDSVTDKMRVEELCVKLTQFPLSIANAFLGKKTAQLSGSLNGDMDLTGTIDEPRLNGFLSFEKAKVKIPFIGSSLTLDTVPITVSENVVNFNSFDVWGANKNPLTLDGTVDAASLNDIKIDLGLNARNFQVMNNDRRARSDLYGKLFLNLAASAKGNLKRLNVNADVTLLSSTNVTYALPDDPTAIAESNMGDVVKFVQFNDTVTPRAVEEAPSSMAVRVNADLNIQPGAQATVLLSSNGTDRVELQPSGSLNYFMNYMGDMRLNGQLQLGNGFARYNIPVIGDKMFIFDPGCYVMWNGELMNPILNIHAYDEVKATVKDDGSSSRLVKFKVGLNATGRLEQPQVNFDLSTDEDMTVQNQLKSMSADQRSQQAMNLLLTGTFSASGVKASANDTNMLYSFLESTLNEWAAKNIRGVDLSFGINQFKNTVEGERQTSTSYSYQVSKSLFNNRFKIVVGGNYTTDASADENFEQNLISDISFEYMLRQTQTSSMYVRLFRHTGWESVLEGEITETGAGFVMKRRLDNLKDLFRFRRRRNNNNAATDVSPVTDTIPQTPAK